MPHTQRAVWNVPPERLPAVFTLAKAKGARTLTATCELWTHPFGWELRLMIDGHGLQMSSVARSVEEIQTRADEWRPAMLEKGWTMP